ncbi:MAG: cell wall-active antibiotics response protein [Chloroflexi bacterium]|nr:cell wall-active antibiotics response protein [Chloroflexota bacterium]
MSRSHSGEMLAALILILLGLGLLAGNLGLLTLNWSLVWPVLLIALGVWLIWRAFLPASRMGGSGPSWGLGDYRPELSGQELRQREYSHGLGDFDLDLTRAVIRDGETFVRASHGLGDLTIIVPGDIPVRVKGSAGLGDVFVLGERSEGIGPNASYESEGYASAPRKLKIEASVGLGEVKVMRAG